MRGWRDERKNGGGRWGERQMEGMGGRRGWMDGWREPGEGATNENIAMHDDDDDDYDDYGDYGGDGDDGACAREMHVQASLVKFKG